MYSDLVEVLVIGDVLQPVDGPPVDNGLDGATSAALKVRVSLVSTSGLTLTSPVKVSAGPGDAGRTSLREISMPPASAPARVVFHTPSRRTAASTAASDKILLICDPSWSGVSHDDDRRPPQPVTGYPGIGNSPIVIPADCVREKCIQRRPGALSERSHPR